jgi:hypothetical protein
VNTTAAARPISAARAAIASSSRGKYAGSTTMQVLRREMIVELVCQMPLVRTSICTPRAYPCVRSARATG